MRRLLKRALIVLGGLLLLLAIAAGLVMRRAYYGKRVYEAVPPALPGDLGTPAILVFSKTNGFRHKEAIPAANAALAALARTRGWGTFFTENGAVFNPADLQKFAVTVWNNTSGDVLTPEQKDAFRQFVERGGGFVGIHGAGGDPRYEWRWYVEALLGAQFKGHPMLPRLQTATIHVEDRDGSVTLGLPSEWSRVDEWYSFKNNPRSSGAHVVATLDEQTYRPRMLWINIGMGADHPIVWKRCVGRGRVFYSALGHTASAYEEPLHIRMLENAIAWAARVTGEGCD